LNFVTFEYAYVFMRPVCYLTLISKIQPYIQNLVDIRHNKLLQNSSQLEMMECNII